LKKILYFSNIKEKKIMNNLQMQLAGSLVVGIVTYFLSKYVRETLEGTLYNIVSPLLLSVIAGLFFFFYVQNSSSITEVRQTTLGINPAANF
jgi:fructose-specific phosphotransferase system IIC component